jgi:general stress protein 26
MSSVKNLYQDGAIQKIQELVNAANICMFTTTLSEKPLTTRPMGTMKVDDNGYIWFFSSRHSNKNKEISMDSNVQLFYSNISTSEYLSIYGEAIILDDSNIIDELWNSFVKTWFHQGKKDPDITVIKVRPVETHYWDTKHNKMISLLKIITGSVTGKTMDDGVEGEIKL